MFMCIQFGNIRKDKERQEATKRGREREREEEI